MSSDDRFCYNLKRSFKILDAARNAGVKRIIFASSSSIYGDNPELPKHEGMAPNPISPYAVTKLVGEYYLNVFNKLYGLEAITLRYFNVFGPRQDPDSQYSAVISKFIKLITHNQAPIIYGDGLQSRDFTYVANIVEANILAAITECTTPLTMNCATHGQISINELVANINEITGKNIKPIYDKARVGDIKHSFAQIDLIKEHIHWITKLPFLEGLKKTISIL